MSSLFPEGLTDKEFSIWPAWTHAREGEPPLISASERRKLADAIAERIQRPLSEIVIEDRGQW